MKLNVAGYECREVLYKSKIATTYRAYLDRDKRSYIIKLLHDCYLNEDESIYFIHEYETSRHINYPDGVIYPRNIISTDECLLIVYDDFEATPLSQLIVSNALSITESLELSVNLVLAIRQVHRSKVIYKNIAPHNIIYNVLSKQVCIIDFGIATQQNEQDVPFQPLNILEGSVAYLSPEQTGRVVENIDYRSDFYSLGVTLYELFTGQRPFQEQTAYEFVVAHLYKSPIAPNTLKPELGTSLSAVIMRLLEKHPSQRYRSADGIIDDLKWCFNNIQYHSDGSAFVANGLTIGRTDCNDRLTIPNAVYGREHEREHLLTAFNAVCRGEKQVIFMSGRPGVGKTTLIREVFMPLTQKGGIFVSGKFDLVQKDVPFSAFLQIFQKALLQISQSHTDVQQHWKARLSAAVADNGCLLTKILPSFKTFINESYEIEIDNEFEIRQRLENVFVNLIVTLADELQPLFIFLDDLQWIDSASLEVLIKIIQHRKAKYLLLIGAYRSNEVPSSHPLSIVLSNAERETTCIHRLSLPNLDLYNIQKLLDDTLIPSLRETQTLTRWLYEKTDGNPYFLKELLKQLYRSEILYFKSADGQKSWDYTLEQMEALEISSVSSLVESRISKTTHIQQRILKFAACLGHIFSLEDLSLSMCYPSHDLIDDLQILIARGFIDPLDDAYRLSFSKRYSNLDLTRFQYRFSHDYMQQTAYNYLSVEDNASIHLAIASLLRTQHSKDYQNTKYLFKIARHYNLSKNLVKSSPDRLTVLDILLEASLQSLSQGAQHSAYLYLEGCLFLLPTNAWDLMYEKTLLIYTSLSTVALLLGKNEILSSYTNAIKKHVRIHSDAYKAFSNQAKALINTGRYVAAQNYIVECLKLYGVSLKVNPRKLEVAHLLIKTHFKLLIFNELKAKALKILRKNDDFKIQEFLILYINCAIRCNNVEATLQGSCKCIKVILSSGLHPQSAFAFQLFSAAHVSGFWDFSITRKLANYTNIIAKKTQAENKFWDYYVAKYALIEPWFISFKDTFEPLKYGYREGVARGYTFEACDCLVLYIVHTFMQGVSLEIFLQKTKDAKELLKSQKAMNGYSLMACFCQLSDNLINDRSQPTHLNGQYFSNVEHEVLSGPGTIPAHHEAYCILKVQLHYLFYDYNKVLESLSDYDEKFSISSPMAMSPLIFFYRGLTLLSLYLHGGRISYQQKKSLDKCLSVLLRMSKSCEENFQGYYNLLNAQYNSIYKNSNKSENQFLLIIDKLKSSDKVMLLALAHELLAQHYQRRGNTEQAKEYFHLACLHYASWGATAKVTHISRYMLNSPSLCES